ncbi:MAG: MerR family transcriptional regulator [Myxococcota bacterium]
MTAATRPGEDAPRRYRMKDLCRVTGLDRQAIHYYIREGLLPPGEKTGRNMAWYDDEHLRRLRLIRKLQHERFLPLRAIKAVLDDQSEGFDERQRRFLAEIRTRLSDDLAPDGGEPRMVPADEALGDAPLDPDDLQEMAGAGFVRTTRDEAGCVLIAEEDVWRAEMWAGFRGAGFTRDLGFTAEDVGVYEDAVRGLVRQEAEWVSQRLAHLPPERVAAMVQAAMPIVRGFLARAHTERVRGFLSSL